VYAGVALAFLNIRIGNSATGPPNAVGEQVALLQTELGLVFSQMDSTAGE